MSYVDGFLLAVPKSKIEAYKEMARTGSEVWKEHGAIAYVECIGDDVPYGELTSFPRAVQAKDDEVVIFSWVVYRSREVITHPPCDVVHSLTPWGYGTH